MFTTVMYRDTGIMTWGQMGHVYNCYVQGRRDHDLGQMGNVYVADAVDRNTQLY